jgi:CubicO group peptidase (beta-lactamase class C family)
VALVEDGEVSAVLAAGFAAQDVPVTRRTLFRAGSISKHVAALVTLRLVADGRLDLDAAIGGSGGITVRHLLTHRSGLDADRTVLTPPGSTFRKANVHFEVLQEVLEDVTGEGFAELARRLVLVPAGMADSSFDQAFPRQPGRSAARGHDERGAPLAPGSRDDLAAAGLWTTAADLARLAVAVRRSYHGGAGGFLDRAAVRALLTGHPEDLYGLGTVVDATGGDVAFGHAGEPLGYRGLLMSRLAAGDGVAVLTNGEAGGRVVAAVLELLGHEERNRRQ